MNIDADIENIVLFVDDAVRYDFAHERLATLGQTHETVAASLHTPASFASIFSGYHVPSHGVTSFRGQFNSSMFNIFDIHGERKYTVALSPFRGMNDSLSKIFSPPSRASHTEIDPPFIWLHRSPGGHAPYGEYEFPCGYSNDRKSREYLSAVVGDTKRVREDYERGITKSIDYFEKIIDIFDDQGMLDDTLFIYTSDHGELLGEYGYLGHNHLACPELVRVPTTFVHPNITSGYDDRLLHNVDIVPMLLDLLDFDSPDLDGFNSLSVRREFGYNHYENIFYTTGLDRFTRIVQSVWDKRGGSVIHKGGRLQTTAIYLGLLVKSIHGKHIRSTGNIFDAYRRFTGSYTYGSPAFSESEFRDVLGRIDDREYDTSKRRGLDEEELENLKDLGYL